MAQGSRNNTAHELSWKKRLLFSLIAFSACLFILELGLRVFYAISVGPDILLYGIVPTRDEVSDRKHTVTYHDHFTGGYSKYFPNQSRVDYDKNTGEVFNVTINNRGFRGKNFADHKEPGVIRVITLGASSTFGYHDRDDETYPHYLEGILNESCGGSRSFEVINLGIPHLNSREILYLFRSEALGLQPDVITFYEGINDAIWPAGDGVVRYQLKEVSILRKIFRGVRMRVLLVKFVDEHMKHERIGKYSAEDIRRTLEGKSERYLDNLREIKEETKAKGIIFIVANQQATSGSVDRDEVKGITYQQEIEMIQQKLLRDGSVSYIQRTLLHHDALMNHLENWAANNSIPFVDVIQKLNQDRDVLVSWVHLTPKGNRMIADALAKEIVKHVCARGRVVVSTESVGSR